MIKPVRGFGWLNEQNPFLRNVHIIDVECKRYTIFNFGRLESCKALNEGSAKDKRLRIYLTAVFAKNIQIAWTLGGLDTHRDRKSARLENGVANCARNEKPIVALNGQPRNLRRIDWPVTFIRVLIIGV